MLTNPPGPIRGLLYDSEIFAKLRIAFVSSSTAWPPPDSVLCPPAAPVSTLQQIMGGYQQRDTTCPLQYTNIIIIYKLNQITKIPRNISVIPIDTLMEC